MGIGHALVCADTCANEQHDDEIYPMVIAQIKSQEGGREDQTPYEEKARFFVTVCQRS